jgi:hypothetical protein
MKKKITPQSAREFLSSVKLPSPTRARGGVEGVREIIDFNAQKNQAMVVASDIVSFVKGVSSERRQDIVNASLLAQLVANKKVPDKSNIIEWYNAYFDVLENEAILKVASVFLGAAPAALAVVISTLEALKSMDSSKSWMTIFDRESKHVKTGHFQIALAEQGDNDQFFVSLMAFSLKAESTITQILFFKIRNDGVELKKCSGKVTINDEVLSSIRDQVKQKITAHSNDYIAKLPDLG